MRCPCKDKACQQCAHLDGIHEVWGHPWRKGPVRHWVLSSLDIRVGRWGEPRDGKYLPRVRVPAFRVGASCADGEESTKSQISRVQRSRASAGKSPSGVRQTGASLDRKIAPQQSRHTDVHKRNVFSNRLTVRSVHTRDSEGETESR